VILLTDEIGDEPYKFVTESYKVGNETLCWKITARTQARTQNFLQEWGWERGEDSEAVYALCIIFKNYVIKIMS